MADLLEYVARVMFHSDVNSPESTMKYHEIAVFVCLASVFLCLFFGLVPRFRKSCHLFLVTSTSLQLVGIVIPSVFAAVSLHFVVSNHSFCWLDPLCLLLLYRCCYFMLHVCYVYMEVSKVLGVPPVLIQVIRCRQANPQTHWINSWFGNGKMNSME